MCEDKVRVDELQGALRKLTEGFRISVQQMETLVQERMEEKFGQMVAKMDALNAPAIVLSPPR